MARLKNRKIHIYTHTHISFPTLFHSPLSSLKTAPVQTLNWNALMNPILQWRKK